MEVTIVGAGAVGLNLAARLARAGTSVHLVSRRGAAVRSIDDRGIELEDPATGDRIETSVRTSLLAADTARRAKGPIVICVRSGETDGIARLLSESSPDAVVVSAQNDVDNEAILARRFDRVIGLVVRQTCTLRDERHVLATGSGRLVVGRYPRGLDDTSEALAAAFETARFDVGRSKHIESDKWLKLCVNGTSTVNALVRREDHAREAFVELKVRLFEESRDTLAAAGIPARSCDGRDRSIDEEIAALRASLRDGTSLRALPLYNACWAALRDPSRPLESDAHHRRIIELGARHGVPTPAHATVLAAVTRAFSERLGPECATADALLDRIDARRPVP